LLHQQGTLPRFPETFVTGWAGMRGVVSLAAALALPAYVSGGGPFPQRDIIIFLTFCAICVTLVMQGLTLPGLIRGLGLAGSGEPDREEQQARRIVIESAIAYLERAKEKAGQESVALYEELSRYYHQRLASLEPGSGTQQDLLDRERFRGLLL